MKSWPLIVSLLFVCLFQVKGAPAPEEPIDCGADKIVPFRDCTSPDGNYAIGWTIRPKDSSTKPVDWSLWKSQEPWSFLQNYDIDFENSNALYVSANYIIDLHAKRLLGLPCKRPYLPQANHQSLSVVWSESDGSVRYALVQNDARFYTDNLWLITMNQQGMHQIDLADRLEKAVEPIVREKMPLDYGDYGTFFNMGIGGSKDNDSFQKTLVVIPFMSSVPKSNSDREVTGLITVKLSDGAVVNATSDTKRDDPIADDPKLAEADKHLNQVYKELAQNLILAGRKNSYKTS